MCLECCLHSGGMQARWCKWANAAVFMSFSADGRQLTHHLLLQCCVHMLRLQERAGLGLQHASWRLDAAVCRMGQGCKGPRLLRQQCRFQTVCNAPAGRVATTLQHSPLRAGAKALSTPWRPIRRSALLCRSACSCKLLRCQAALCHMRCRRGWGRTHGMDVTCRQRVQAAARECVAANGLDRCGLTPRAERARAGPSRESPHEITVRYSLTCFCGRSCSNSVSANRWRTNRAGTQRSPPGRQRCTGLSSLRAYKGVTGDTAGVNHR